MANLTADFQFNINLLNLNYYYENLDTMWLNQGVNDPWEDRYTVFTEDEAVVLHGNGFSYGNDADMVNGTVEAMSEWYYDDFLSEWVQVYSLSDLNADAGEIYAASQSANTNDDFALLQSILSGKDLFNLSEFNDKANGYGGNDRMFGHGGNDTLKGNDGSDKLFGGHGRDKLFGGHGKDRISGGNDDDILRGGKDNDVLRGGKGRDEIEGGHGEDVFKFMTGDDTDVIKDFELGTFTPHDVIDLSELASVKGWRDLTKNHMTQDGKKVVIDGRDGDLLILRNTDMDELSKAFFEF